MLADLLRRGLSKILLGPINSVIDTSTVSTATGYSNQRKIDRCQNGVLWAFFPDQGTGFAAERLDVHAAYSTDNGETWTNLASSLLIASSSPNSYVLNFSVFIDLDDYCHIVYKNPTDGIIEYRRGTPNAERTSWTWSNASVVTTNTAVNYPDLVAFRNGTGWEICVVAGYLSGGTTYAVYSRISLNSGGAITGTTDDGLPNNLADMGSLGVSGVNNHSFTSIDFNHTGDGKTVAGGTPHLYVAWSKGATGAGKGIYFRKATYSGGTWTWGTEREIDSTRYISSASYWLNCLFDGTRAVIAGFVETGTANALVVHERDAADTTTTTRALLVGTAEADRNFNGSATYDGVGNIYVVARTAGATSGSATLAYRKWTRATTTLETPVAVETSAPFAPYVSVKRGYSNNRIEFIYTDGTASPYDVTFGGIDTP